MADRKIRSQLFCIQQKIIRANQFPLAFVISAMGLARPTTCGFTITNALRVPHACLSMFLFFTKTRSYVFQPILEFALLFDANCTHMSHYPIETGLIHRPDRFDKLLIELASTRLPLLFVIWKEIEERVVMNNNPFGGSALL